VLAHTLTDLPAPRIHPFSLWPTQNETSVVFISDIGAAHTTLMIAGTAVVWTFYTASLLAERYLRAIGRLPTSGRRSEAVVGWIVVALGFLGGAALCLLS